MLIYDELLLYSAADTLPLAFDGHAATRARENSAARADPPELPVTEENRLRASMFGLLALLSAAALSQLVRPAIAEDWHPRWNVISGDRQTVSSTCIGSNSTPQCLVDSAMACGAWSIPIGFSADGSYHDDAVCMTSPGIERAAAPLSVFAPPALMKHHYLADFWELTEGEMIDGPIMQYPEPWKPGDLVADLYTVSCAPEKSCMSETGSTDPARVLALCPQTHCSGTPFISRNMDGDGSLLFRPWTTLILRQGPEGWRAIATYIFANAQMHNDTAWVPNRWRRQE